LCHVRTPSIIYDGYNFGLLFRPSSGCAPFRIAENPYKITKFENSLTQQVLAYIAFAVSPE
jgi:hypothetical protein